MIMRALLEFLGIVAPDASRREPVALPAWLRHSLPILVVALAAASTLVFAVVRALID
jgi:hypothetical protein